MVNVNKIDFSSAGGDTITMTQSTAPGIRAMTGVQNQIQFTGSHNGTISHAAISQNLGFFRETGSTKILTITNAYSLLLNPLDDYGAGFTFTNRWGIYQAGASDKNYFAANSLFGTTTDTGQKVQVAGDSFLKGSGSTSATNALLIQNSLGTELLKVRNDGLVIISSQGNGTARIFGYGSTNTDIGSSLLINGSGNYEIRHTGTGQLIINKNTTNDNRIRIGNNFSDAQTSGDVPFVEIFENNFNPTSGTATLSLLKILATINQTGGANGITRGLYINPTLTSAADWRAIEVSDGISILAPSTTASATLRIPSGTAPSTPTNGDIWFDGTNLFMRIGGLTKTFTIL
jgi:hypothetical protein